MPSNRSGSHIGVARSVEGSPACFACHILVTISALVHKRSVNRSSANVGISWNWPDPYSDACIRWITSNCGDNAGILVAAQLRTKQKQQCLKKFCNHLHTRPISFRREVRYLFLLFNLMGKWHMIKCKDIGHSSKCLFHSYLWSVT